MCLSSSSVWSQHCSCICPAQNLTAVRELKNMIYHAYTTSFFAWEAGSSYTEITVPIFVLYFSLRVSVGRGTEVVWDLNERENTDGVGSGGKVGKSGISGRTGSMVRMGFSKERGVYASGGWRRLQKLKSTRWNGCLHFSVFILRFLCWFTTEKQNLNPYFCSQPPFPKTGRYEQYETTAKLQVCFLVIWCIYALTPSEMSSSWFSIDIFICPSLFRSWPLSLWPKLFYVESKTLPPPGTFPAWEDPPQSVLLLGLRELENTVGGLVFPFPSTPC